MPTRRDILAISGVTLSALAGAEAAKAQVNPPSPGPGNHGQATSAAAQAAGDAAKASGDKVGPAVSAAVRSENSRGQGPKK
jgi:hypothetical protein